MPEFEGHASLHAVPARSYSINGERRSYALLRPIVDVTSQNNIREIVLDAFAEYEERAAVAS